MREERGRKEKKRGKVGCGLSSGKGVGIVETR